MKIYDLKPGDEKALHQVAEILVAGFMDHWPNAWPDIESGLEEANKSLESGKISRIASDENGNIVGWIGAIPEYNNNAWELHPLVVHPDIGKVTFTGSVETGKTIYRAAAEKLIPDQQRKGKIGSIMLSQGGIPAPLKISEIRLCQQIVEICTRIPDLNRVSLQQAAVCDSQVDFARF